MNRSVKIISLVLVMTLLCCSLCACANAYPRILEAFQEEGFSESSNFDSLMNSLKESLEQQETPVSIHLIYNVTVGSAFVIEFKSTQEMRDTIANNAELQTQLKNVVENEDVQQLYRDAKEAGLVNGNCVLIPFSLFPSNVREMIDIFKNA